MFKTVYLRRKNKIFLKINELKNINTLISEKVKICKEVYT